MKLKLVHRLCSEIDLVVIVFSVQIRLGRPGRFIFFPTHPPLELFCDTPLGGYKVAWKDPARDPLAYNGFPAKLVEALLSRIELAVD